MIRDDHNIAAMIRDDHNIPGMIRGDYVDLTFYWERYQIIVRTITNYNFRLCYVSSKAPPARDSPRLGGASQRERGWLRGQPRCQPNDRGDAPNTPR
jgi:hypothetical protein